jgi:glycerol uptake facilitator-like aquaporin
MIVVGSGIMGQRLAGGNDALALLANSLATGAGLYALIAALLATGAHFNPAVTVLMLTCRRIDARLALECIAAQCAGAVLGVVAAHAMFGEALLQAGVTDRAGWPLLLAEFIATVGLLVVVWRVPGREVAAAVGAYIAAAYWFTASTSFANPAVTLARAFTGSFAGIAWPAVPGFITVQLAAAVAVGLAASRMPRAAAVPPGRTDTVRS